MFAITQTAQAVAPKYARQLHQPVIVSAVRTPVGSFLGTLASVKGSQLGAIVVKAAIEKVGMAPDKVNEVVMGNVLTAGTGQAPARQAAIFGGLPKNVTCTTINKVCASGMKAIAIGSQSIMLGHADVVIGGGFESMSNVPYYLDGRSRNGLRLGDGKIIDGMIIDGLWDVYNQFHMAICAENTAKKYGLTREMQDEYAIRAYKRSADALEKGYFKDEIVPVSVPGKKGDTLVVEDEEIRKVDFSKLSTLKPAFDKNGTVTAANASKLNDGASAVLLTSAEYAKQNNLKPLARVVSFADAERDPIDFPIAPALAIPLALKRANLTINDIDIFEVNEAFSTVPLANIKELNLDIEKLNPLGGGVSMGHAIGSSGCRIVVTLLHHLRRTNKRYGCAAICNGGGGATSIVIENLDVH
eukprot:TRINITY_DN1094_c0_g1_i1.p1 TRINITY_DN1094_c0_g1~~TRINITY_DN1094_c0_g1_i1.p1  ORF type:complete len:414 (+),score=67.95 TRINITY_DN1094_c0_g1_i1:110-1351(+)